MPGSAKSEAAYQVGCDARHGTDTRRMCVDGSQQEHDAVACGLYAGVFHHDAEYVQHGSHLAVLHACPLKCIVHAISQHLGLARLQGRRHTKFN